MKKELICIVCPVGCHLTVDEALNVSGNRCKRGIPYAKKEMTNPERQITSTVRIHSEVFNRLSVKTSAPIPKAKRFDIMRALDEIDLTPPVETGDVIIENVAGTDADIVASRRIEK